MDYTKIREMIMSEDTELQVLGLQLLAQTEVGYEAKMALIHSWGVETVFYGDDAFVELGNNSITYLPWKRYRSS